MKKRWENEEGEEKERNEQKKKKYKKNMIHVIKRSKNIFGSLLFTLQKVW